MLRRLADSPDAPLTPETRIFFAAALSRPLVYLGVLAAASAALERASTASISANSAASGSEGSGPLLSYPPSGPLR
jgi:hypothetical protein